MGNTELLRITHSESNTSSEQEWNHIMPLFHYCGLANIVPAAEGGTLEEHIKLYYTKEKKEKRPLTPINTLRLVQKARRFGPIDTLRLALQAARGLYQAQLYWDGKATFAHADLNPSQYLVFLPVALDSDKIVTQNRLPLLQINDFNQGRFLTRSIITNDTCPFMSCSKNTRGNRYHPPERFIGCVNEDESTDAFSLGSVFFFILTNGLDPHYDTRQYGDLIKNGTLPNIPAELELNHPAYDALIEVMIKCFSFNRKDRPSSLEVVNMLEKRLKQIQKLPAHKLTFPKQSPLADSPSRRKQNIKRRRHHQHQRHRKND